MRREEISERERDEVDEYINEQREEVEKDEQEEEESQESEHNIRRFRMGEMQDAVVPVVDGQDCIWIKDPAHRTVHDRRCSA